MPTRPLALAILFLATGALFGCANKQTSSPKSPLDEFKAIVDKVNKVRPMKEVVQRDNPALDRFPDSLPEGDTKRQMLNEREQNRIAFQQGYRWMASQYTLRDLTFDVQKTDSLVSPFTAYLEFSLDRASTGYVQQSLAESNAFSKHFKTFGKDKYHADYSYQDSKWILKELRAKLHWERDAKWQKTSGFAKWWDELEVALRP